LNGHSHASSLGAAALQDDKAALSPPLLLRSLISSSPSRLLAWLVAAALVPLLGAAIAAAPARASHAQALTFEAPGELLSARTRPHALAQLDSLGVHALRVVLYWRNVAPSPRSSRRPSFDATDPTRYAWGEYDALLAAARQRHWTVLLDVSGPVPRWATSRRRDYVTHPDPMEFGRFMTAVGRHYGSQVPLFSIWNEPNHPAFLQPQFAPNGAPASPRLYRALFQAGYAGLQASGLRAPRVLMGDTAPTGADSGHGLHDVAPLAFLRGALCLDTRYRKARTCSALPAAGYAHHAYTKPAGPLYRPPSRDDVTIGVLSRLTHALDRAARAHALRSGLSLYLTEFGIQSKPNRFLGVPVAQQAEFDAISERIAYDNPRVKAFSQFLLRDDSLGGRPGASVRSDGSSTGFQTGLEYHSGKAKPLFGAFRIPLTVNRLRGGFALWGLVRPTSGVTHVDVLVQDSGSRRARVLRRGVTTDRLGYWRLHVSDASARTWRVRWRSPSGTTYVGPPIRAYR